MLNPVLITICVVLTALIALVVVVLVRTISFKPPQASSAAPDWQPQELAPDVIERLQAAIQIPTVSWSSYDDFEYAQFERFGEYLKTAFPLFHEQTQLERINEYGLIYRWPASSSPNQAEPLLPCAFLAHYDVVPVEAGTEDDWHQPAFSGAIVDDVIWGRGTLDIKSQLLAYLEAAEQLIHEGFQPNRDFYFCFGFDEEVGGSKGAKAIVEHFLDKGIRFESVIDEGGMVITGAMKGVNPPLALIGIAEKGHVDYKITVEGQGGHSSMPPQHTALGLAARLITYIENNPMPARISPAVEQMLRNVSGEMGFVVRMAISNLWLFRPLLLGILAKGAVTNAMARTSCAATMAQASDAPNVLPQTATININVRLLPGDTIADVQRHLEALALQAGIKPEAFKIEPQLANEASATSRTDVPFFRALEKLIGKYYPGAITTPYLVMGGTDARYYTPLSEQVYRFMPAHVADEDRSLMHNTNERLSTVNYYRMTAFFKDLFCEL